MRVLIKGAGDLATGIGWRLVKAGYRVWMTDLEIPTAVRRSVSFSRAVYEGEAEVEGVRAKFAETFEEGEKIASEGFIPVLADPEAKILKTLKPEILVDAIMAKKNLGTRMDDATLGTAIGWLRQNGAIILEELLIPAVPYRIRGFREISAVTLSSGLSGPPERAVLFPLWLSAIQ